MMRGWKMTWKYRKKGDRIVIECNRKYKATLPRDAKDTYDALLMLRHTDKTLIASLSNPLIIQMIKKKFAQDKLHEQPKDDTNSQVSQRDRSKIPDKEDNLLFSSSAPLVNVDDMIKAFKEAHEK